MWIIGHLVILFFTFGTVFLLGWRAFVAFVVIVGLLSLIDSRRRHETFFLANLGVSATAIVVIWSGVSILLEIGARLVGLIAKL